MFNVLLIYYFNEITFSVSATFRIQFTADATLNN